MRLKCISLIMLVSMALAACTATVVAPSSIPAIALPQTMLLATSTTVSLTNSTAPTTESCSCKPKPALTLIGLVDREQAWSVEDLRSLGFEKFNISIPKEGNHFLEGMRLNTLLDIARSTAEANSLTIIAGDGTTVDVDLKAVRACTDCLIALYGETNSLRTVMSGFPDNTWIKAVKELVVK